MYQLKSPESSNISVCLFTDFDSEVNVNPSTESNMIRLKSTSLDMKTMDSKSNGALAWSNSFDLGCNSTFNYTFHSSSGESALVPVQAESLHFERPGYSRSSSGGHLKAALTGGLSLIDGQ